MVFTTHFFLFYFLPLVLLGYYLMPRGGRAPYLTLVSYVFYGWANPKWVLLLWFSTAVDFLCGLVIHRAKRMGLLPTSWAKRALVLSIVSNLGLLAVFKYFDFMATTINQVAGRLGQDQALIDLLQVALPVGISFYTFQSMSYTIDVYRGQAKALHNPMDFACYVALFPQLVAGPIVRYRDIAEQLLKRTHDWAKFSQGVVWFCLGLAKKIVLANPLGFIADTCFEAGHLAWVDAWIGVLAYAFQIYFDFSGYSDMAIGLGLMLGFRFPKNFDSPYTAYSITDFWRRWHISLSSWLRDYLYIPLGGNRKGAVRTYLNLAIVMLLGGLWHGASWNFVIWGALHGSWLALERFLGRHDRVPKMPRSVGVLITFMLVCIAWVFFRAPTLDHAWIYLQSMFGFLSVGPQAELVRMTVRHPFALAMLGLAFCIVWRSPNTWRITRRPGRLLYLGCLMLFGLSVVAMWTQAANPFLYFQF